MSIVQIMALVSQIWQLLRSLKKDDQASFSTKAQAAGLDNDFIKKLWENRKEILDFILKLIDMMSNKSPVIGDNPLSENTTSNNLISSSLESLKTELQD